MAVAYRASASVVNGTASTSVVVSRPGGTVAGDVLVATVAEVGVGAITPPAGWSLVGSQASGSALTYAVYTRTATGTDPASWTWTLGSSVRAWGQISAYTGVDPSSPVIGSVATSYTTSGTVFSETTGKVTMPWMGVGITTTAATRTASGTATTWSTINVERVDVSTNGGTGTDITGTFGDGSNPLSNDYTVYQGSAQTASQTQAAAVVWVLTLNPYWPPIPAAGQKFAPIIEIAPGADLTADPATWPWVDVTRRARGLLTIRRGQQDKASVAQPSRLSGLRLVNDDGWLTPWNPASPWFELWGVGTPLRASMDLGITLSVRFQGYVDAPNPGWPADNSQVAEVVVSASGELQRISADGNLVASPLATQISGQGVGAGTPPVLYWTFEEASGSTAASEFFGGQAIAAGGSVQWATDSSFPGSKPLPRFPAGSSMTAPIPVYTDTHQWKIEFAFAMSAAPAATTTVLRWTTDGPNAATWSLQVDASSVWTMKVTPALGGSDLVGETGTNLSSAPLAGKPLFITINALQSGGSVITEWLIANIDQGGGGSIKTSTFTLGRVTSMTFAPDAQLNNSTFGHWAFFTATDEYDSGVGQFIMWDSIALAGNDGDSGWVRILQLCQGAGVALTQRQINQVYADTNHAMGVQSIGTLIQLLQEAVDVDGGLLADGRGPGIAHLGGDARYNAPVQLALDAARRQVKRGFTPAEDDTRRRNDITANRTGGGTARFTQPDGPLGTRQAGSRQKSITVAVHAQQQLLDYAAWTEHVADVPELRSPTLNVQLRDTPELVRQWAGMDLGLRYTAAGLMTQYPNQSLDNVLDYYEEDIDAVTWNVRLTGSPASVYRVFVVEDPLLGHAGLDGQYLAAGESATDTAWLVASPILPLLTTSPADHPYYVACEGEVVQVTAAAGVASDNFGRTSSSTWTVADSGQSWTNVGGASTDHTVSSGAGRQALAAAGTTLVDWLDTGSTDMSYSVDTTFGGVASAGTSPLRWSAWARATDLNNGYHALLELDTAGTVRLNIRKVVGGTLTNLTTAVVVGTNAANDSYTVTISVLGSTITASVVHGTTTVVQTVTDTSITAGTLVGPSAMRVAGNTNTVTAVWDHLIVSNPQTLSVKRSINGVVKAHAAGTPLQDYQPGVVAL